MQVPVNPDGTPIHTRTTTMPEVREERRQVITGNITRKEIKLVGKPHDINRLMAACNDALKTAAERGNFNETYLVHADAPHEEDQ